MNAPFPPPITIIPLRERLTELRRRHAHELESLRSSKRAAFDRIKRLEAKCRALESRVEELEAELGKPGRRTMAAFARGFCERENVSLAAIRSDRRGRPLIEARHRLIRELAENFPNKTPGQIADVVGKDRTTILRALGRLGPRS